MSKNNKSFLRKMIIAVFTFLSIVGLVMMIFSITNFMVSPGRFVWSSFFGLAFWLIFFFNLLCFIVLLLCGTGKTWIPVISILIAVPGLFKTIAWGKENKSSDSIRVLSYNIHNFKDVFQEQPADSFAYQIMDMINEHEPDILCMQEFNTYNSKLGKDKCITEFSERVNLPHVYYNRKSNYGGNVIFSKYPLEKMPPDTYFGDEEPFGIMVKVDAGEKGQFQVGNFHLASFGITEGEIEYFADIPSDQLNTQKYGKSIARKLKSGFIRRCHEVETLMPELPGKEIPTIICGDFNDTPLSNTYHCMKQSGYKDSFLIAGKGLGTTYAGRLPWLRIDYVWANMNIQPSYFERIRFDGSDHYPVMMEFNVKEVE